MIAHARAEAPDECCGLLVGGGRGIEEAVRARNARASPTAYLVDPRDHFALIRRLRGEPGRAILGAYHSHVGSAAHPSETDLREAHYPDFVYVIVSLRDPVAPEVAAFHLRDGSVEAVPLVADPA